MGAAIRVSGVSKSYSTGVKAINNLSFNIKKGEIVSILGESGSGKSTLLRLLAGLEDADEGTVIIGGQHITGPSDNLVPGYDFITLVFQDFKLQRFKTTAESVASEIYFLPLEERNQRVGELLDLCRLADKADSYPHELSGGQQQRLAIAIALAGEPEVVLMDEPFSNLDFRLKEIIRQEVVGILRKAGVTVVMVSHDHTDALSVADRVMVVRGGRKVQMATPEELYHHPKDEYAANFLGPINYIQKNGSKADVGIRPEKVKLNGSGPYHGVVERNIFQGMFYHIYIRTDISENNVLVYSPHGVAAGTEVNFDLLFD